MIRASTFWKYQFAHHFSFLSIVWLAVLIPVIAFIVSNTASPAPVMSVAASNIASANPIAQPVSFTLSNDVNALQQQSLLGADSNSRAQAVEAANTLRRQWSSAIGVQPADWYVSATAPQDSNQVIVAVRRDLYTSTDSGKTFQKSANVLPG